MKLIAEVFRTPRIIFGLKISPKVNVNKSATQGYKTIDAPLLKEYTSKAQTKSLIFNPIAALTIKPGDPRASFDHEVLIPLTLVYQFSSVIYDVAEHAAKLDKWTTLDPDTGRRIISQNDMHIRKFSIFNAMLYIEPTLIGYQDQNQNPGILLRVNDSRGTIGTMYTYEVSALVDMISHMDVTSYTLLAAMAEQNTRIEHKVDMILDRLSISPTMNDVGNAFQTGQFTDISNHEFWRKEVNPPKEITINKTMKEL